MHKETTKNTKNASKTNSVIILSLRLFPVVYRHFNSDQVFCGRFFTVKIWQFLGEDFVFYRVHILYSDPGTATLLMIYRITGYADGV